MTAFTHAVYQRSRSVLFVAKILYCLQSQLGEFFTKESNFPTIVGTPGPNYLRMHRLGVIILGGPYIMRQRSIYVASQNNRMCVCAYHMITAHA